MRYNYPGGHFDEWFLEYDGGTAWFTEDEGTYSLFTEVEEAVEFPDITGVRAGQNVMIGDRKVMVKEKGTAGSRRRRGRAFLLHRAGHEGDLHGRRFGREEDLH